MTTPPKAVVMLENELQFHFEKSSYFRVIHVDGAFGGLSPGPRMIHMAVFSERQPLPKSVTHKIDHGVLGPEIADKRQGRSGIFREIEADLVMSVDTAISMRAWLDEKIIEVQQATELVEAAIKANQSKGNS